MLVEITKKEQTFEFSVEAGEKLLYAALRAGIPLPYECATGTCGTCKGRLKEGDIDEGWSDAPGKEVCKEARQEFLMCQASGGSSCKLAIPGAIRGFRDDDIKPDYYDGSVTSLTQLTADVIEFSIELSSETSFHAGQFFVLEVDGVDGYRAYSMTNYSPATNQLDFVLKRKPSGGFSDWAFDIAREGSSVKLFGPLGRATFHPDEAFDLVLVGGGSGIAGLMSILKYADESGHLNNHNVALFFGVRTRDDGFFLDQLAQLQRRHPDRLSVNCVFSHEEDSVNFDQSGDSRLPDCLNYSSGMVHTVALETIPAGATDKMVYLAGPPPMIDAAIRSLILDVKFPADQIRYDKFG